MNCIIRRGRCGLHVKCANGKINTLLEHGLCVFSALRLCRLVDWNDKNCESLFVYKFIIQ